METGDSAHRGWWPLSPILQIFAFDVSRGYRQTPISNNGLFCFLVMYAPAPPRALGMTTGGPYVVYIPIVKILICLTQYVWSSLSTDSE